MIFTSQGASFIVLFLLTAIYMLKVTNPMRMIRTSSTHPDFQVLAGRLEQELRIRDGDQQDYYAQLNQVDAIQHVLVVYEDEEPVGCGAVRPYDDTAMEVKRMYVRPDFRGKGIATALLQGLESWSLELGYTASILETGKNQPEAIALYRKNSYQEIPRFGKYKDSDNSVCFIKEL